MPEGRGGGAGGESSAFEASTDGFRISALRRGFTHNVGPAQASFPEPDRAKTVGFVEIEFFADGGPGGPVGMGGYVGAFVEVGAPLLAGEGAEGTSVFHEEGKGDGIFEGPRGLLIAFDIQHLGQGMVEDDVASEGRRNGGALHEIAAYRGGVLDVIEEKMAAAICFEVEIPHPRFRLDKKFYTGVFADAGLVFSVAADDVTVFYAEENVEMGIVVEEFGARDGPVAAASGVEMRDVEHGGLPPSGTVPLAVEGGFNGGFSDGVAHVFV